MTSTIVPPTAAEKAATPEPTASQQPEEAASLAADQKPLQLLIDEKQQASALYS
jgi:hypothetical protein